MSSGTMQTTSLSPLYGVLPPFLRVYVGPAHKLATEAVELQGS